LRTKLAILRCTATNQRHSAAGSRGALGAGPHEQAQGQNDSGIYRLLCLSSFTYTLFSFVFAWHCKSHGKIAFSDLSVSPSESRLLGVIYPTVPRPSFVK